LHGSIVNKRSLSVDAARRKICCHAICDSLGMATNSVIGVALNFQESLNRLTPSFAAAPYNCPPQAPITYLKTPNTWIESGQPIPCPAGTSHLRMAGTLGVVIGRTACNVKAKDARAYIGGYTVVNDISIPHHSYFRPALRQRCSNCFCSIGATAHPHHQDIFEIGVVINNILRSVTHTNTLVRPISQLIQDITEFMTFQPGDILLIGEPETSPLAVPGDAVRVEIPGVGVIENRVVSAR
jgi:5-oxopent-3-ene-1,2,5-tricarboxylate decarboxylase/2-hydroxyhepta-2,4-diene-1,7-dioate isomerase